MNAATAAVCVPNYISLQLKRAELDMANLNAIEGSGVHYRAVTSC